MNELKFIKSKFKYIDNEPDIYSFGLFRQGLTGQEIKEYIQARANKLNVSKLIKNFYEIAGRNTVGVYTCYSCKKQTYLMYHEDVLRFANVLFGKNKYTYFD
jgi:hypothetical protein